MRRVGSDRYTSRLTIALALTVAGCSNDREEEPDGPPRPNVVLVSIDSLRPDHLSCYGYERETSPVLDKLAAGGVRFENAVSTTSWTLPSHAAMFTGLFDSTHGLVDNGLALSDSHVTLPEALKREGYHTAGFYGGPYLHPTFGFGQGFDVYTSCMTTTPEGAAGQAVRDSAMSNAAPSHRDITGPRTFERVEAWADARLAARAADGPDEPYFLFLHLWDVHYDYFPPDEIAALFVDPDYSGPADGNLMSNPAIRPGMAAADLAHVLALYDAEIRFTDFVLGKIFEGLERRGLLENTLVIVTSDHGEEFFEHGLKGHNKSLFDEVLRVPLIISWPGRIDGGQTLTDQVQIVDFVPTVAAAVGLEAQLPVQGRDLGPLMRGRSAPPRDALSGLFIDGGSLRSLRSNERKVIRPNDRAPAVYFDLQANPGELLDRAVHAQSPDSQELREGGAADLERAISRAAEFKRLLGRRDPDAIEIPDALREELSKHGYVGDDE